jgi:phage tail-like protein
MDLSWIYPPPAYSFTAAVAPSLSSGGSSTNFVATSVIDAAFQEISGIDPKVDVEEVVEGGNNAYVHQLPGVTKHSNLVLKRGYVLLPSALGQWARQTVGSTLGQPIQTQSIVVILLGPELVPLVTWTFLDAWPVKWEVGTMEATNTNSVLTQTLEISYSTVSSFSSLGG